MNCSICYEEINATTGKMEMADCNHAFHYSCITKWFTHQENDGSTESCPFCRHQPGALGRLPSLEESESDSVEAAQAAEAIEAVAATARASALFSAKKATMTKSEFEHWAATKIAAGVKGFLLRRLRSWDVYYKERIDENTENMVDMYANLCHLKRELLLNIKAKYRHQMRKNLGYHGWLNYNAREIQKWWKKRQQRKKMVAAADRAIIIEFWSGVLTEERMVRMGYLPPLPEDDSLTVAKWKRVDENKWQSVVRNPEEDAFVVFNRSTQSLPPQSLSFAMATAAMKLQKLWRGHSVRRSHPAMPCMV